MAETTLASSESHVLRLLCAANRSFATRAPLDKVLARTDSTSTPELEVFVDRLARWGQCSPPCLAGAFTLLQRLEGLPEPVVVTSRTVHRVFFACVLVATKVLEDDPLSNRAMARVASLPEDEVDELQDWLLSSLAFRVFISARDVEDSAAFVEQAQLVPCKRVRALCAGRGPTSCESLAALLRALPPGAFAVRPSPLAATGRKFVLALRKLTIGSMRRHVVEPGQEEEEEQQERKLPVVILRPSSVPVAGRSSLPTLQ